MLQSLASSTSVWGISVCFVLSQFPCHRRDDTAQEKKKNAFSFMPSESKRSYSKTMNSYSFWVSQIAKTKAAEKRSNGLETHKPALKPTNEEEVVVTRGPRKPEILDPLNLATKINKPRKKAVPPQPQPVPPSPPPATPSAGTNLQENLDRAKRMYGQLSPYAQHTGGNLDWMPIGTEPSSSDPEHPHTISVNRYGELGCDCRGYIFHKGPEGKTCTHCKEFAAANN
jgi:hypothetical protein